MTSRPPVELRRAVLAFTLREQGELSRTEIDDSGVHLPAGPTVPWDELDSCDPTERAVARWLRLRLRLDRSDCDWVALARPVALPVSHEVLPNPNWAAVPVLGGALDLGVGLRGFDDEGHLAPERVGVTPLTLLRAAGLPVSRMVDAVRARLDQFGALAAERHLRSPSAPLRPVGDCDVVTLLTSRRFREMLVADCSGVVGMRSAAVPSRRRGWLDLRSVDPAFVASAAMLTEPDQRAFSRPILVTIDEVVQVRPGGATVRDALTADLRDDPAAPIVRTI